MKTKLVSLVAASMLLTGVANATDTFANIGYSSVSVDGENASSGAMVEFGVKAGENFKHTIATKFIYLEENEELSSAQGSILEFYYALGYEVLPSTILSAKVGAAFQQLGTVGTGANTTSAISRGLSYGAIATYEINEYLDVSASYTQSNSSYMELDYAMNMMDVSIGFKF